MAFLARFPRTVLRHLQQCSLADDHGDSFLVVCTFALRLGQLVAKYVERYYRLVVISSIFYY